MVLSARIVAAQLISRHWIITDAQGIVQEVRGLGVVGAQPLLQPGESFEYTSWCQLATPSGSMHGTYRRSGYPNVPDAGGHSQCASSPANGVILCSAPPALGANLRPARPADDRVSHLTDFPPGEDADTNLDDDWRCGRAPYSRKVQCPAGAPLLLLHGDLTQCMAHGVVEPGPTYEA